MKTFVISDIHGCYEEFLELLIKVNGDFTKDRLVILGDYIDMGPKSYEVLKKVINPQVTYGNKNVVLLKGNHEQMAVEYFKGGSYWIHNGGQETIKSFSKNEDDITKYLDFFRKIPQVFRMRITSMYMQV